jgi:hypothetical protein
MVTGRPSSVRSALIIGDGSMKLWFESSSCAKSFWSALMNSSVGFCASVMPAGGAAGTRSTVLRNDGTPK